MAKYKTALTAYLQAFDNILGFIFKLNKKEGFTNNNFFKIKIFVIRTGLNLFLSHKELKKCIEV